MSDVIITSPNVKLADIDLPVINLSPKVLSNPEERKLEAQKLVDAFTSPGFCHVIGIENYDSEDVFGYCKWFFNEVPLEEKMSQIAITAHNPSNRSRTGYYPLIPGILDFVESHHLRSSNMDDWKIPEGEEELYNPWSQPTPRLVLPGREEDVGRYYKVTQNHLAVLEELSKTMLSLIAEAGGERSDYFRSLTTCNLLRTIKYPVRSREDICEKAYLKDGRVMNTHEHVDGTLMTLLDTFGFPGLEIELDGKWFSVPPRKDALIVNVGELLTDISDGRFKSTIHRVMDIGKERFSMAMLQLPTYNADINMRIPRSLLPNNQEMKEDEFEQDETKQDETKQDQTKQDQTKQNKTKQDQTKQGKTKQDEIEQDQTKQDQTKQYEIEQDKIEQDQTKQDEINQDDYYPYLAYNCEKMRTYRVFSDTLKSVPQWMREKYVDGYERRVTWADKFNRLDGV